MIIKEKIAVFAAFLRIKQLVCAAIESVVDRILDVAAVRRVGSTGVDALCTLNARGATR
jgi:hypothetical protein